MKAPSPDTLSPRERAVSPRRWLAYHSGLDSLAVIVLSYGGCERVSYLLWGRFLCRPCPRTFLTMETTMSLRKATCLTPRRVDVARHNSERSTGPRSLVAQTAGSAVCGFSTIAGAGLDSNSAEQSENVYENKESGS